MVLNFPSSPSDGQVYDNYYFDSSVGAWNSFSSTTNTIPSVLKNLTVTSDSSSLTPLTIKGAVSQTGFLQEWLDSNNVARATISPTGAIVANSLTLSTDLSVENGGTGASDAATARTNLGITPANIGAATIESPSFSGTVTLPSTTSIGNVSNTELATLDGVTSGIQSQLDAKANLSGATFTNAVYSSFTGGNYHFKATNTSSASDQYNYLLVGANDTGDKAVHFVNSSTRTIDGGANSYTVRNDGGMLNLGNSSYNTNIYGKVTMPQQPAYSGSIQYSPAVNAYPVTYDTFIIGFSKSGNNRLTAQVAGKYYVAAQQLINGGSYLCIQKNGSEIAHAYSNADDTYDMNVSALIDLQVNDYVELYYHGGSLSYAWGDAHSRYSVFKVS